MQAGTIMCVEVIVKTRGELFPNWELNPVSAIMVVIHNEAALLEIGPKSYSNVNYLLINKAASGEFIPKDPKGTTIHEKIVAVDEIALMGRFIKVCLEHDPEIILGYETEIMSIGYLCKRAEKALNFKLNDYL